MVRFVIDKDDTQKAAVMEANYMAGTTVEFSGNLGAVSTIETKTIEADFGDPITKTFAKTDKTYSIVSGNLPLAADDEKAYTDAIINFNPTFIKSKIKSDYLLFEEKENNTYNHLGIAFNKNMGERYIETFFYQPNDMYITGQSISKISKFNLYDAENRIMVSDSF